jgi:hypothetical protein
MVCLCGLIHGSSVWPHDSCWLVIESGFLEGSSGLEDGINNLWPLIVLFCISLVSSSLGLIGDSLGLILEFLGLLNISLELKYLFLEIIEFLLELDCLFFSPVIWSVGDSFWVVAFVALLSLIGFTLFLLEEFFAFLETVNSSLVLLELSSEFLVFDFIKVFLMSVVILVELSEVVFEIFNPLVFPSNLLIESSDL